MMGTNYARRAKCHICGRKEITADVTRESPSLGYIRKRVCIDCLRYARRVGEVAPDPNKGLVFTSDTQPQLESAMGRTAGEKPKQE